MSSSSSTAIITTVWRNFDYFLLLEDTISTAQTCRTPHSTIIDAEMRQVKVTHFEVVCTDRYLPRFLPQALNYIHFSSLWRLRYPPRIQGQEPADSDDDDIKGAITSFFPIITISLYRAQNLEHLFLNALLDAAKLNNGSSAQPAELKNLELLIGAQSVGTAHRHTQLLFH